MHSRPHFRILGVPVRIEPLFWVVVVLLAINLGDARLVITWIAVVLVSILVHELGHALALRVFGQSSSIVLHGFGGLTFSQRRLSRGQSIAVSLAGPLAALGLLGIPALLLRDSDIGLRWSDDYFRSGEGFGLWPVVVFGVYVNVWWSLANLLPIRPLDGGNVLTELIGVQRARLVSIVVGAGAAVWAFTHTDTFRYAAIFAGFLAFINLGEYRRERAGHRLPSAFDITAPTPSGGGGVQPGSAGPSGSASGSRFPPSSPTRGWPVGPPTRSAPSGEPAQGPPAVDRDAAVALAWRLLREGDELGARRAAARAGRNADPFLGATLDVAEGRGVDSLVDAYLAKPGGPSTLVAATVLDDRGQLDAAIDRLAPAGGDGVEALGSLQTHLHYAGRFAAAARVGERSYPLSRSGAQVAFDTACAWSKAEDPERAMTWLERARADGFGAVSLLDGEPDLEACRTHPAWPEFRARF